MNSDIDYIIKKPKNNDTKRARINTNNNNKYDSLSPVLATVSY